MDLLAIYAAYAFLLAFFLFASGVIGAFTARIVYRRRFTISLAARAFFLSGVPGVVWVYYHTEGNAWRALSPRPYGVAWVGYWLVYDCRRPGKVSEACYFCGGSGFF